MAESISRSSETWISVMYWMIIRIKSEQELKLRLQFEYFRIWLEIHSFGKFAILFDQIKSNVIILWYLRCSSVISFVSALTERTCRFAYIHTNWSMRTCQCIEPSKIAFWAESIEFEGPIILMIKLKFLRN